jgi:4-amino-4-deoxy-L-arabinose transferase-like glycosyltransferase
MLFFNNFGQDDAIFADLSRGMLSGKIAVPFFGNFLWFSQCYMGYPPAYPVLGAIIFKFFGASYLTSKIISLIFATLTALFVSIYSYRILGFLPSLIVTSLTVFDSLLFSYASLNRPDVMVAFFVTIAALLVIDAEKKESPHLLFIAGLFSGIAFMTSYRSMLLFLAFFCYCAYSIYLKRLKYGLGLKKIVIYFLPACIISLPWFGWIMMDGTRRIIFLTQVLGVTGNIGHYTITQTLRSLLNPLADLYLFTFRSYSPFAIIFLITCIYMLLNFKKYAYPFFVLAASLVNTILNPRGAYNLIPVMPFCYIFFGYIIKDKLQDTGSRSLVRAISVCFIIAINISIFYDVRFTLEKADVTLDTKYCSSLIKTYTEKGSRVATDPVFIFAEYEGRDIIFAGLLIWELFRRSYRDYNEVVETVVGANYLILSERIKRWGELPIAQSVDFQKYLKERCVLLEKVDDGIHGSFWIYKSNHRDLK